MMTESHQDQAAAILCCQKVRDKNRRVCSQAIAIKPTRDIQATSAEDMYKWDMATWRMYTRITDYRQKHSISADYDSRPQTMIAATAPQSSHYEPALNLGLPYNLHFHETLTASLDDTYEDNIFDLEM